MTGVRLQLLKVVDGLLSHLELNEDAIEYLRDKYDPLTVFAFLGPQGSGKSAFVQELIRAGQPEGHAAEAMEPTPEDTGVWMYIEETAYEHAKHVAYLDVYGYGVNKHIDAQLFGLTALLSSTVFHVSLGAINESVFGQLGFLEGAVDVLGESAAGHLPPLQWVVRDLPTKELKAIVGSAIAVDPSADIDQLYLNAVLDAKSSPFRHLLPWQILTNYFPKRSCTVLPAATSPAYEKKASRLGKTLVEKSHVASLHGVPLTGSILASVVELLVDQHKSILDVLHGAWDTILQAAVLDVLELAIGMYKAHVDAQLPLANTDAASAHIALPCDASVLDALHGDACIRAAPLLARAASMGDESMALAADMFKTLSNDHIAMWHARNDALSKSLCLNLLISLHTDVEASIAAKLHRDENDPLLFSDFKSLFRFYNLQVQHMIAQYATDAKGPQKMPQLAAFYSTLLPKFILYLTDLGAHRIESETIASTLMLDRSKGALQQAVDAKVTAMESIKATQAHVQAGLVVNARLEKRLRDVLDDALEGVSLLYDAAKLQGETLEREAFVNVERTAERVLEVTQKTQSVDDELLEGYLIKQGGGGVFGRKNWKQRYFVLHRSLLSYAKTKDDYERGKILKELSILGCDVRESQDAGEGFEIWPPLGGQGTVYDYKQGMFASESTNARRKVDADSDRKFYLRASSVEVKELWVGRLRQAAQQPLLH
ncbi:hypothetical protein SPRG_19470 [Saprolegnia parasitica CBS 223.65]|uniref:PH domain-containing protein n=1 Tax=Saprolegnia parasitica (strain CBS 223.65) TaxID=695850 RepID=A0A067CRS1_SAPPC|nr:hypothetical protein SPRG_19470 [Saprolegnia parasitica CBS 223.65]KDO31960.1 hypothetical protein SPRG_19470 [Saprolegnia parasitica CBS 223.65]|eukprot:XP_012197399.1 hypothetical protein SPRG_19470 [Saprolegnia parasitica CBS 223.65]